MPAAQVPRPDPGDFPADPPREVRTTLEAAWLASQGEGWAWRLVAYQRVLDLADDAPIDLLRRALVVNACLPRQCPGGGDAASGPDRPDP